MKNYGINQLIKCSYINCTNMNNIFTQILAAYKTNKNKSPKKASHIILQKV